MAIKDGDENDNTLAGTDEPDRIQGFGGRDRLSGGKGNDVLAGFTTGGADNDRDVLFGGEDNDVLYVGRGDVAYGGAHNDAFIPQGDLGAGTRLDGGSGVDTLSLGGSGIAGAAITGIERLMVGDFPGGRLTAEQLGLFSTVLPLAGKTSAQLNLTEGGAAFINPVGSLATLKIGGSDQGETLTLRPNASTRLEFLGGNMGASTVSGGAGGDRIEGNLDADLLYGGRGDDVLAGHRVGSGAADFDRLFGEAGNDTLHAGVSDRVDGGADDDLFLIDTSFAPALLDGGAGVDTLRLSIFNVLGAGNGFPEAVVRDIERLEADSAGGASLTARQLDRFDSVAPLAGNRAAHLNLVGGGNADIAPDTGLDDLTIIGSDEAESLTLAPGATTNLLYHGDLGVDGIGTVVAARGNDRLEGGGGDDLLDGGGGNDTLAGYTVTTGALDSDMLLGRSGRDTLYVGFGDTARGGDDNDLLLIQGGFGAAVLDGGAGIDVVRLGPGQVIAGAVLVGLERLEVAGESGAGRLTARQLSHFDVVAPLAGSTVAAVSLVADGTGRGFARAIATDPLLLDLVVNGSNEAETFSLAAGSAARLTFIGNGGDDIASGTARDDIFDGGSGNDFFDGGEGDDVLDGGGGIDLVGYAGASVGVRIDLGNPNSQNTRQGLDQLISIEKVYGSTFADRLVGSAAANSLIGGFGDDTLFGGDGGDRLTGLDDADDLYGEAGDDVLSAGAGSDALLGGAGLDRLTGDFGADLFVFRAVTDSAVGVRRDIIADFTPGEDVIGLSSIDASSGAAGNQAFAFIGGAAFGGVAGQLRFAAGRLSGDVDGDGDADFEIAVAGATSPVGEADLSL